MTPQAIEYERLNNEVLRATDDARRMELTSELIQLAVDDWLVIPILEATVLYASNPANVGYWEGIYGRAELGDVYHRIPHVEGNPWP